MQNPVLAHLWPWFPTNIVIFGKSPALPAETPDIPPLSKTYVTVVTALTLVCPAVAIVIDRCVDHAASYPALVAKWFIFFAVGIRLTLAGLRQITKPGFTSREIFHIEGEACYPIVRELGFANLCFGLIGIISLFVPAWRIVSCFGSGLYYGLAALSHFIKRSAGPNEMFALVSDVFIFLLLGFSFFCNL
jgi:hypothetical protein